VVRDKAGLSEGKRNLADGFLDGLAERAYTISGDERKAIKRRDSYWSHDELDNMTVSYDVGRLAAVFPNLVLGGIAGCAQWYRRWQDRELERRL